MPHVDDPHDLARFVAAQDGVHQWAPAFSPVVREATPRRSSAGSTP